MNRRVLLGALPPLVLLVATVGPLVLGHETLYLRDVLNAHLQMTTALADAFGDGRLPLVDGLRGGQPLLGNLNASPLYPTRLLLLVASPLWVLNAHFWIHWLLAPWAMFALARAWGLPRPAAWAAGLIYATCGYFVSLLNLHNLVAGAALLPAFVAAVMTSARPNSRRPTRALIAATALWTLLLLAGDPLTAVLALILAVSAVVTVAPPKRDDGAGSLRATARRLIVPLSLGTLLAAPQLVAFAQILSGSYRGHWGYSRESVLAASWNPATVIEWFVPFFFGRPDRSFWGAAFFGGNEPFYLTLFPGVLAVALVLASGRPRSRVAWWAWGGVGLGMFLALGAHNPVVHALAGLGGSWLRYPIKVWPLVAVGGALLAGLGFARLDAARGRRDVGRAFGGLAVLFVVGWWFFGHPSDGMRQWMAHQMQGGVGPGVVTGELERWAALCFLHLVLLALLFVALSTYRRHPTLGGALLLTLHVGAQFFFLQPARDTDDAAFYATRPAAPALLDAAPAGWTVHGRVGDLFGPPPPLAPGAAPDTRTLWDERRRFAQWFPQTGALWGRGYDLDPTPEGLDSFLSVAFRQALRQQSDAGRLRLLASAGVDTLLLDRPLDPRAAGLATAAERSMAAGAPLYAYRLAAAPAVAVATRVRYAANVNEALDALTAPDVDPIAIAVLPGTGSDRATSDSSVDIVDQRPESLTVEVNGEGGVLLWQRAHLPVYRATVDGVPVDVLPGNIFRLAVDLPPGPHTVRIWADRRPLYASLIAALVGLALLVVAARRFGNPFEATIGG